MATKRCAACGRLFNPWPQIPNQQFCSEPDCQRERRRRKQQAKRKNNPVVRDSDAQYLRDWVAKNPDYWKAYRGCHPEYVERNRRAQLERNQRRIAKDNPSLPVGLPAGRYQMIPVSNDVIANEDVWIVEIIVLSASSKFSGGNCKVKS